MISSNPQLQSPLNISAKDKFIMLFELPEVLKRIKHKLNYDSDILQTTVYGTVVPDVSVPAIEAKYGGQGIHTSSFARPMYSPITTSFAVDNRYKNYTLLFNWLNILNDSVDSVYGGFSGTDALPQWVLGDRTEYQTTVHIFGLDEYNKPVVRFDYTRAFITKLGGITYSYRDANTVDGSAEFYFSQLYVNNLQ